MSETHDYTRRYWGHDYTITDVKSGGQRIFMSGWGRGINKGDFLLLESQSADPKANKSTRYKVASARYHADPSDLWAIEAVFAPRPRS